MAAKDYQICCGWKRAYIAKTSKRDSNLMLQDRREISEAEILSLIHWWAKDKAEARGNNTQTITVGGKAVVEVTLLGSEDEE